MESASQGSYRRQQRTAAVNGNRKDRGLGRLTGARLRQGKTPSPSCTPWPRICGANHRRAVGCGAKEADPQGQCIRRPTDQAAPGRNVTNTTRHRNPLYSTRPKLNRTQQSNQINQKSYFFTASKAGIQNRRPLDPAFAGVTRRGCKGNGEACRTESIAAGTAQRLRSFQTETLPMFRRAGPSRHPSRSAPSAPPPGGDPWGVS